MKLCSLLFLFLASSGSLHSTPLSEKSFPLRGLPSEHKMIQKLPARVVELTGTASYINPTKQNIDKMIHHFTVPAAAEDYQILLSVTTIGVEQAQWLEHKNKVDHYLKLTFALPAQKTLSIQVTYRLLIIPVDYNGLLDENALTENYAVPIGSYLLPSKHIESEAPPFIRLARQWQKKNSSALSLAKRAYEFPARHLKFAPQTKSLGALKAYQSRKGDCTEYSSLFCALSRALSLPARQYSVFSMGDQTERSWSMPNHTLAEVYLKPVGWLPIDPNLSFGKYTNKHSFGKTADNIIYFQHEGAWVWGNHLPQKTPPKSLIKTKVSWHARVLASGPAEMMFLRYNTY